jgi:hypothetical protein
MPEHKLKIIPPIAGVQVGEAGQTHEFSLSEVDQTWIPAFRDKIILNLSLK